MREQLSPFHEILWCSYTQSNTQFGTIGYDFKDPYINFSGLKFALRLSTENNIYCPNPKKFTVQKLSNKEIILKTNSLSAAGGQLISKGMMELKLSKDLQIKIFF